MHQNGFSKHTIITEQARIDICLVSRRVIEEHDNRCEGWCSTHVRPA